MHRYWTWGIIIALAASNIVLVALLLMSGRPLPPGGEGPGPEFLVRELRLTGDQRREFEKLLQIHHRERQALLDQMRQKKLEFFGSLTQPDVEGSILQRKSEDIGRLQSEIDMLVYRHLAQLRSICDEAQRTKLDNLIMQGVRAGGPPAPRS
ncbi:MAG: periplasmic heavy metal sensor [Acidobacteria bacterium]|nr:periplasmic heavy metal sensor [Acidobacteriota bacterium]